MSLTPDALARFARDDVPVFVIDIETTGTEYDADIIEFGLYDYATGEGWGTFVRPERYPASKTEFVTGISDEMVKDAPSIQEALDELHRRAPLDSSYFIAHNGLRFDFPKINAAIDWAVSTVPYIDECNMIDSLNIARHILPWYEVTAHTVTYLIDHYGIEGEQEHRAQSDCWFTAQVLNRMLDEAPFRGVDYADVNDLVIAGQTGYSPTREERAARKTLKALEHARSEGLSDRVILSLELSYNLACEKCN